MKRRKERQLVAGHSESRAEVKYYAWMNRCHLFLMLGHTILIQLTYQYATLEEKMLDLRSQRLRYDIMHVRL